MESWNHGISVIDVIIDDYFSTILMECKAMYATPPKKGTKMDMTNTSIAVRSSVAGTWVRTTMMIAIIKLSITITPNACKVTHNFT